MKIIPFVPKTDLNTEDVEGLNKIQNLTSVLLQKVEFLKHKVDELSPLDVQREIIPQLKQLGIEVDSISKQIEDTNVKSKAG